MENDLSSKYRQILNQSPPAFVDRVDNPWAQLPDVPEFNEIAYRRIVRALEQLQRADETNKSAVGVLVLGEAGTGKTHLLMRVAKELSKQNHILFVRKPNNEEAVAQHVWSNIVQSLTRKTDPNGPSQMDDLLGHVFAKVLISEFEKDIAEGVDVEQRGRWVKSLREDALNLFRMLGEGERRKNNMELIRKRTLRFLSLNHPEVDQSIASGLIRYCLFAREDWKRLALRWLSGQDLDEAEAAQMGMPPSWISSDEASTEISSNQQREEMALRAIQSLGKLSLYYQPLILAFDQLEGLRDEQTLTRRWGDVLREIFTMAPNILVVTCIFPSLWETWFKPNLDESVSQRIAQSQLTLEQFQSHHAIRMLEVQLRDAFTQHRLPTSIYPFEQSDVEKLCAGAPSPRSFIQSARTMFESWLDSDLRTANRPSQLQPLVTQDSVDRKLEEVLNSFTETAITSFDDWFPIEPDHFGRIKSVVSALTSEAQQKGQVSLGRASLGNRVMPPNVVIENMESGTRICFAVMQKTGYPFTARFKNTLTCLGDQFDSVVLLRDVRCASLGQRAREQVESLRGQVSEFVFESKVAIAELNGLYDLLTAVEEKDVSVGGTPVSQVQAVGFLRNLGRSWNHPTIRLLMATGSGRSSKDSQLEAAQHKREARDYSQPSTSITQNSQGHLAKGPENGTHSTPRVSPLSYSTKNAFVDALRGRSVFTRDSTPRPNVDVVIGSNDLNSPDYAVIGELTRTHRRLAISLNKPQGLAIFGYMGSGKSYALGVLIESVLLSVPNLISQKRPQAVVAFNYRSNPEARFEFGGFGVRNSVANEVERLQKEYGCEPARVGKIRVLAYEPEIPLRAAEYQGIEVFPICFRPGELGAEHWEILMKPPSAQTEYMDIVRDIIRDLFYKNRLTLETLEHRVSIDQRLSETQRRRAFNRLSFARRWLSDGRPYEWEDLLTEGSMTVVDLRMQTLEASDALKLVLVITDQVRKTKNGVNKVIVFDEAHEYVDSRSLMGELENALTQIRHDGLSFILASQFPDRIPENIFKYLLVRILFKLPHAKGVQYLRRMAANLSGLSDQELANLDLEQGKCLVQTDDDCSDELLRRPQLMQVRPRLTMHGGATIRQDVTGQSSPGFQAGPGPGTKATRGTDEADDESKPLLDLNEELGIPWKRMLTMLGLPLDTPMQMTLGEARRRMGGLHQ